MGREFGWKRHLVPTKARFPVNLLPFTQYPGFEDFQWGGLVILGRTLSRKSWAQLRHSLNTFQADFV